MSVEKLNKFYIPELDGLRFIAFLLVYLSHAPFITNNSLSQSIHEYGWIGVDLFLCLSAFLITKLLILEYQTSGEIHVHSFYLRRILKIWPLYFLFIGFLIVYQLYIQDTGPEIKQRILGMALFSDNILAAFLGYNHLFSSVHLWTISYEEQFYLMAPWLIRWLLTLQSNTRLLIVTIVLISFSAIRGIFIYFNAPHPAIWVLPITHFESVLGGLILGLGVLDPVLKRLNPILLFLIGILFAGLVFRLPNTEVTSGSLMLTYPLIGIGMTLLIHSAMQDGFLKTSGILNNKLIVYLGKISYGLYVYHLVCLLAANQICDKLNITPQNIILYPAVMIVTGLCLVILCAMVSYHLYEKFFLDLKRKFTFIKSRPI